MVFLNITVLIALSILISMHTKLRIEVSIPFAMCYTILFYYIFAICGVMGKTVFFLFLLSFLLYGIYLFRSKHFTAGCKSMILTPGFVVFLFFAVFMWWFNKDLVPTQWDEFSHWALTVKDIYYSDRLGTVAGAVTHYKSYPPAMAIWQYFFLHLHDTYRDGILYYAYNMFLVCMMLPITRNIKWKNCFWIIAAVVLIFFSPYLFYAPFDSIPWGCLYIERAMTFCFSYILFTYYTQRNTDKWVTLCQVGMGTAVLTLLKSTGIYLCAISITAIFVDILLSGLHKSLKQCFITGVKFILPITVFLLAANMSWSLHLNAMNVSSSWSVNESHLSKLIALLTGNGEDWQYSFAVSLYYFFFSSPTLAQGNIVYSCAKQPFVWLALIVLVVFLNRKQANVLKRHISLWLIICIGFGIYYLSVYMTYVFFLGESETTIMASVHRYVATYWLGAFCFFLFYLFDRGMCAEKMPLRIIAPLCSLFLVCNLTPLHLVEDDLAMGTNRAEIYAETNAYQLSDRDHFDAISETLTSSDKIYVVTDDNLFWHLVSQYELLPYPCNRFDYIADITSQELSSLLNSNNYTYLWIQSMSDEFTANCGELFEDQIEVQQLYRVQPTSDGVILSKYDLGV